MQLKASAPGSLMLLGEYAVLYGKTALVSAVDKRMTVTLTPRDDQQIHIRSALGEHHTDLTQFAITKPFHFVMGAIKQCRLKMFRGCDIEITAEFSDQIGLGSSAAVTVATLAALVTWLNIRMTPVELVRAGRQVIREAQGIGSGADIAAAVYGGMVAYRAQPMVIEKFALTHPLTAIYAGFKTPTIAAIKHVQEKFIAYPNLLRTICQSIGQCAQEGIQAVRKEEWTKLGAIMNVQQGMMEALGVNLPVLDQLITQLRQQATISGAKISGSGLGDCVIGLGDITADFSSEHARIPVAMTLQGVQCEKI